MNYQSLYYQKKNTRRREQGGATTSGFNTLEIDPETGKPILERKKRRIIFF